MKIHFLKFTAFLLIIAGMAASCNPVESEEVYPKDISFTEYLLDETSCQWQNLPYDEKVIIINSSNELDKYISYTEGSFPAIDFSKHSLLLVSAETTNGIDNITKRLQQLSATKYKLDIEIQLDATIAENWVIALITSKINDESYVELNVILNTPIPEITLQGTKWKLVGIVDLQTGDMTILEPQNCNECYTIAFETDSVFNKISWFNGKIDLEPGWYKIFIGRSCSNFIVVWYRIDYKTGTFQVFNIGGTEAGEMWDGWLYRQILFEIQSFILKDTYPRILHLYYNDGKKYLKYKEIEGKNE